MAAIFHLSSTLRHMALEVFLSDGMAWILGFSCMGVAGVHVYRAKTGDFKGPQRLLKAINWAFLGGLYFYLALFDPANPISLQPVFRAVLTLLIIGEFAYYTDVVWDIFVSLRRRIGRGMSRDPT